MATRAFYTSSVGFLCGVGVYEWRSIDTPVILLFLLLASALLLCSLIQIQWRALLLVGLFLLALAGGMTRSVIVSVDTSLSVFVGEEVTLSGIVHDEPVHKERTQQVVVTTEEKTKILAITASRPRFQYGDEVTVQGVLTHPEAFETESGRTFNYPMYLAKDDIFYQMLFPDVRKVGEGKGNVVHQTLFAFKEELLTAFNNAIPQPHAALLGGLVVGAQESLGDALLDDFRVTGIIHIVVLSGYNVTIVAESIRRFFGVFLPRLWAFLLGACAIVLFAILVGAGATIIRASIMALVALVGRYIGRSYAVTRVLVLAGVLMVLVNPHILLFDPSFQLSFLATVGLTYLTPLLDRCMQFVPTILQLREFAATTTATQLFVLPLLLYQVGELSLAALPVNMLVLAVIPITMLAGFLTGMVGMVSVIVSLPFAYFSYGLLAYILNTVELFAQLPYASVTLPPIPLWGVAVLYALYCLLLWYTYEHTTLHDNKVV